MSVLDEYEEEYLSHVNTATQKLDSSERCQSLEERRQAAAGAERAIEAARDQLQLMELEGRTLPAASRTSLLSKLRSRRAELDALKARVKVCRAAQAASSTDCIREDLFSPCNSGGRRDEASERSRMLASNERLAQGTSKIRDAHATTLEMESTAAAILGDLGKQRETLMNTRATLNFANEHLAASRRVLNSMARRAAANKAILYLIIGLVGALVLFVAWSSTNGEAIPAKPPHGADWHPVARSGT